MAAFWWGLLVGFLVGVAAALWWWWWADGRAAEARDR